MSPFGTPSTLPSTACMPRFMLIPWSASPIAESSWVRYSLFSAMTSANDRTQRTASSKDTLTCHPLSRDPAPAAEPRGRDRARRSDPPTHAGGPHRRVPEIGEVVVQLQERDREPLHLQRGDVVADQVARDLDPAPLQELVQLVEDDVELDQGRATH